MNKTTIQDVARRAGVSAATVSRVLNVPGMVSEEKRTAVLEAIDALNYVPDMAARVMAGKKTGTIAVVIPNVTDGAISRIINGIVSEAEKNEFNVQLFTSTESAEKERSFLSLLKERMVNGAIFICGSGMGVEFASLLRKMPVVTIERLEREQGLSTVQVNSKEGFTFLIRHLKELGHSRIGYLAGDTGTMSGHERLTIFREIMEAEQLYLPPQNVVTSSWTMGGGYAACEQLIRQAIGTTAIVCSSDLLAIGALAALREKGIRVPDDLSITGFDHSPQGEFCDPPLSTLEYPAQKMGELAVTQLICQMMNPLCPAKEHILMPKLLLKRSTAAAPNDRT